MTPALLAQLRRPGQTDDDILDALRAMAASLPAGDKAQEALDACISRIEETNTLAEELAVWLQEHQARIERAESMPRWLIGGSI